MGESQVLRLGLALTREATLRMTILGEDDRLCAPRMAALFGGVGFDVGAEGEVDVEGLADAVVQHAEPVAAGLLEFHGAEEIAGLDDDFEGVGEVVGELADLEGEVLGDLG